MNTSMKIVKQCIAIGYIDKHRWKIYESIGMKGEYVHYHRGLVELDSLHSIDQ